MYIIEKMHSPYVLQMILKEMIQDKFKRYKQLCLNSFLPLRITLILSNMKKLIYLLLLSFVIVLTSCQKVIDIDVSDTEPKLVIEALYDAVTQKVSVNISKTVNVFSATNSFPAVNGATVKIIDENNLSLTLNEEGEGRYTLENYAPIYNSLYKLQVLVEGVIYEAQDSLVSVVPLDSLR